MTNYTIKPELLEKMLNILLITPQHIELQPTNWPELSDIFTDTGIDLSQKQPFHKQQKLLLTKPSKKNTLYLYTNSYSRPQGTPGLDVTTIYWDSRIENSWTRITLTPEGIIGTYTQNKPPRATKLEELGITLTKRSGFLGVS